jgi:hypothetical protein
LENTTKVVGKVKMTRGLKRVLGFLPMVDQEFDERQGV